jgi:hypothetical protein
MTEATKLAVIKQQATHEFKQFVGIFLYLAFFFCSITTYRTLLLKEFQDLYVNYSFALINAFVLAKVILIGEYAHLGKRYEQRPLLVSALYKALLFSLLVICFHYFEEGIKRLWHGEDIAGTLYETGVNLLLARALVVFSTFVPFFAFREMRRVLGEDKFHALFFKTRTNTEFSLTPEGLSR